MISYAILITTAIPAIITADSIHKYCVGFLKTQVISPKVTIKKNSGRNMSFIAIMTMKASISKSYNKTYNSFVLL